MNPGLGRTKLEHPARRFGTAIPDVAAVIEAVNELAEGNAHSRPGALHTNTENWVPIYLE